MKSLCIKDNNQEILNFILDNLEKLDLDFLSFHKDHFKIYENIIIHYKSKDLEPFYDKISSILTDTILKFYEKRLLRRMLEYNYFYFSTVEKRNIIEIAEDFIAEDVISKEDNYYAIYSAVSDYIRQNKSLVLGGFANFRLYNYCKNLDYVIDFAVNKYITDKEYLEFVNMLKLYVNLTPANSSLVHLVYLGNESVLLDKDKNIIPLQDDNLNTKYLSDITFSANDYALNTLLNLTPKRIIIHLMEGKSDEFIDTIKLIFDKKCEVCSSLRFYPYDFFNCIMGFSNSIMSLFYIGIMYF